MPTLLAYNLIVFSSNCCQQHSVETKILSLSYFKIFRNVNRAAHTAAARLQVLNVYRFQIVLTVFRNCRSKTTNKENFKKCSLKIS